MFNLFSKKTVTEETTVIIDNNAAAAPNTKYGVLRYSAVNIGDDIQSVAAMRFLPNIDYYIPREEVGRFKSENGEKVKLIMNAWWMWKPDRFPPSEDIDPLFISFHLREKIRPTFLTDKVTEYLKAHGPVGCRDTGTMDLFKSKGIDAYFTGCLTSTLLPNNSLKGKFVSDYVLCVDCPDNVVEAVKKRSEKPVYSITRMLSPAFTSIQRFDLAKFIMFLYHNASVVVTPRLHVGLPAVAFEVPVCMLCGKDLARDGRFDGLDGVFNEVDADAYVNDGSLYDINNPPANPEKYKEMAAELIKTTSEFTGFDSQSSPFADDYNPMMEIIQLLAYDKKIIERLLIFATPEMLVEALDKRVIQKKSKYDLEF